MWQLCERDCFEPRSDQVLPKCVRRRLLHRVAPTNMLPCSPIAGWPIHQAFLLPRSRRFFDGAIWVCVLRQLDQVVYGYHFKRVRGAVQARHDAPARVVLRRRRPLPSSNTLTHSKFMSRSGSPTYGRKRLRQVNALRVDLSVAISKFSFYKQTLRSATGVVS